MRRLWAILPIIAIGIGSNALVASAGLPDESSDTTGYTILRTTPIAGETPPVGDAATTESTVGAEAPAPSPLDLPSPGDVGAQQGPCEAALATVDLASGVVTALAAASTDACATDLTFAPDGTLYGVVGVSDAPEPFTELVTFDTTTGAVTVVGAIGSFNSIVVNSSIPAGGITFDAQGRLFVMLLMSSSFPSADPACLGDDDLAYCLYRIDDPTSPETSAVFVGRSVAGSQGDPGISAIMALNATCTGVFAGRADQTFDPPDVTASLAAIDTETGTPSALGDLTVDHFLVGQATDRAGTIHGIEVVAGLSDVPYFLSTLDPSGGSPVDTIGLQLSIEGDDEFAVSGFAIAPLDCGTEPIVIQPTFTG